MKILTVTVTGFLTKKSSPVSLTMILMTHLTAMAQTTIDYNDGDDDDDLPCF